MELTELTTAEYAAYKTYRKLKDELEEVAEPAWLATMKAVDAWYVENAVWELLTDSSEPVSLGKGGYETCINLLKGVAAQHKMSNLVSTYEDRFFKCFELSVIDTESIRVDVHKYRVSVVKGSR